MASEGMTSVVTPVAEDVPKQQGTRLSSGANFAARKQEEAALKRNEAAGWLMKTVGAVGTKDLPEEPSEEEFRLGLRNGIILCHALNKVQPGTVTKVVEAPADAALHPDGAAMSAFQYFENVRNFLVSLEELGLPSFEASDLGQDGKVFRVVNCVLALKAYNESKPIGKNGSKHGGLLRHNSLGKIFARKNSERALNSLSRSQSIEKILDGALMEQNFILDLSSIEPNEMTISNSLIEQVRTILSEKKPEEIPLIVGSLLSKVMQECERRIANQNELVKTTFKDMANSRTSDNNVNNMLDLSAAVSDETKVKTSFKDMSNNKISDDNANNQLDLSAAISDEMKIKTTLKDMANDKISDDNANNQLDLSVVISDETKVKTTLKDMANDKISDDNANNQLDLSAAISDETKVKTTLKDMTNDKISDENADNQLDLSTTISDETKMEIEDDKDQMKKEENNYKDFGNEESINTPSICINCINNEEMTKERLRKQGQIFEEMTKERLRKQSLIFEEMTKEKLRKQGLIFDRHVKEIQELKDTLRTTRAGLDKMKAQYPEEFNNCGKQLRVLVNAASGYHRVLEENRKLYNQVQDLKGNIRVYCRVRPFKGGEINSPSTVAHFDNGSITIASPAKNGKESRKTFNFNRVFGPAASQEEVFTDTQPLIRSILDGYNVCIFAYGQTGAGKTHTMTGPKELNEKTIGVNYRALNDLFHISEERKDDFTYEISVQMMEIYNEQVRDLLTNDGVQKRLEIRNSSQNGGLAVPDANLVPVKSPPEVIDLMNLGHKNRAASSTAMNDRSSRSHSCLTIHVQGKELASGTTLRGCMHLVDLAGSERVNKSEVRGDRLKEAQHINKSLAALGDVISALAQKSTHVPFRNSKLTQLLQDSLGGQAKTLMFVHISPEVDAVSETLSTLKFAERVATIELGAAQSNKDSTESKDLKEQIAILKAALARKEEEPEHFRTAMSSPDLYSMKSNRGFPANLIQRQPMEDMGNMKELIMDTESSWEDTSIRLQKSSNKELGSEGWVDTITINKEDQESLSDWDGDSLQEPDFLYQDHQRSQETEDSDGDSSEDMTKLPGITDGASAIKKPQSNSTKIPTRTVSHPPIPSASKKISPALTQTPSKTSKQPLNANVVGKKVQNSKIPSKK